MDVNFNEEQQMLKTIKPGSPPGLIRRGIMKKKIIWQLKVYQSDQLVSNFFSFEFTHEVTRVLRTP